MSHVRAAALVLEFHGPAILSERGLKAVKGDVDENQHIGCGILALLMFLREIKISMVQA